MDSHAQPRISRRLTRVLSFAGVVALVVSLAMLAKTTQNSVAFGRLHSLVVLFNALGLFLLLLLIAINLYRLLRDYRSGVAGARLKARMIGMFASLALLPLMLVYLSSMYFLNSGIDSYFNIEVEQGMDDALVLSRTALDLRMREHSRRLELVAERARGWSATELVARVDSLRRESGASELLIVEPDSGILLAASNELGDAAIPEMPANEVMLQIRQGIPYVTLEPRAGGALRVIAARELEQQSDMSAPPALYATFPITDRLSDLAGSVQSVYSRYDNLVYLREPLKDSFKLTLTLILVMSMLLVLWGVFFFARRIVEPIQNLVAGTRAVAAGDFDMRLPEAGKDDVGFLVRSFNDMTRNLADARELAAVSQNAAESERAYLRAILGGLSSGVIALRQDLSLRSANDAASLILGMDLASAEGAILDDLAERSPLVAQFLEVCRDHIARGGAEWREQIVLRGEVGRRVLTCAGTRLPGEAGDSGGYVVVLDDVTALMQAQRDAAWGEVARRLAHEIKNPLTPIQLSAERLRRRYLPRMDEENGKLLEQATRTIVQQVDAMKVMVDAFRDYARAPDLQISRIHFNRLLAEIVDSYRTEDRHVHISDQLDPALSEVAVDTDRFRQIVHNLLRNALEALHERSDGAIVVSSELTEFNGVPVAGVRVSDNGPGFPAELLEQVFEPYVTSKPRGTGLGLSIVKKLVEEHAGRIFVGNADSGGAWVRVLFPLDEESRNLMLSAAASAAAPRRERA